MGSSDEKMWVWHSSSWLLDWRTIHSSYGLKYKSDGLIILLLLWDTLDMNNFYFPFFFIFWLYRNFVFFFFSFGWWRGTWQGSYMTGHMMWCHRPRPWWKDLEDDVRAYGVCMVALSKKWGEHEVEAWTIGQV